MGGVKSMAGKKVTVESLRQLALAARPHTTVESAFRQLYVLAGFGLYQTTLRIDPAIYEDFVTAVLDVGLDVAFEPVQCEKHEIELEVDWLVAETDDGWEAE